MRMNDKIVYQLYHIAGIYSTRESAPLARILMLLDKNFVPFAVGTRGKKNPECEEPRSLKYKKENHEEHMMNEAYMMQELSR